MLLSYFKLSLRLLARNPFLTFINVAGLSVGFSVFFILWQYSQTELNSDKQFALPVGILVLIMLGTVATVVWKAAKNNPVEALKYE